MTVLPETRPSASRSLPGPAPLTPGSARPGPAHLLGAAVAVEEDGGRALVHLVARVPAGVVHLQQPVLVRQLVREEAWRSGGRLTRIGSARPGATLTRHTAAPRTPSQGRARCRPTAVPLPLSHHRRWHRARAAAARTDHRAIDTPTAVRHTHCHAPAGRQTAVTPPRGPEGCLSLPSRLFERSFHLLPLAHG